MNEKSVIDIIRSVNVSRTEGRFLKKGDHIFNGACYVEIIEIVWQDFFIFIKTSFEGTLIVEPLKTYLYKRADKVKK